MVITLNVFHWQILHGQSDSVHGLKVSFTGRILFNEPWQKLPPRCGEGNGHVNNLVVGFFGFDALNERF